MLLTADHDDRVSPLHSYKYAAELQYRHPQNPNPILLRVDKKAGTLSLDCMNVDTDTRSSTGHGAGKSIQAKITEAAEKYGFVSQAMGLEYFEK